MEKSASLYEKVEMHWHFYGKCGISISTIKYLGNPATERMHFHDFHELVIVREGTGRHVLEDGSWPLFKGNVFLVRPGTIHGYEECRNFELINVLFFPELLLFDWAKVTDNPGIALLFDAAHTPFCLKTEELDDLLPLLQSMLLERREKKSDFEFAMNADFMQLLFALARFRTGSRETPSAGTPRWNQLLEFLRKHDSDPTLQICGIAEANGMTIKTLERLFLKNAGVSPSAYLAGVRLEHAAQLLRNNPECSVTEIALRCGFSDLAYFSRVFRRKFAVPPREFRKQYCRVFPSPHA